MKEKNNNKKSDIVNEFLSKNKSFDFNFLSNALRLGKQKGSNNKLLVLASLMGIIAITRKKNNSFGLIKALNSYHDSNKSSSRSNNNEIDQILKPLSRFTSLTRDEKFNTNQILITLVIVIGLIFVPKTNLQFIFENWFTFNDE